MMQQKDLKSGINTCMAGKLFDKLEREAFRGGIQRTKESQRWFRTRVASLKSVNRTQLQKDARQRARPIFGDMYMMMYDPKHKRTLPYYDRFPLVIPMEGKRWVSWIKFTLSSTWT